MSAKDYEEYTTMIIIKLSNLEESNEEFKGIKSLPLSLSLSSSLSSSSSSLSLSLSSSLRRSMARVVGIGTKGITDRNNVNRNIRSKKEAS